MPFITPIILAAGGGKRIGRPKALLPFGNATLLEHVIGKCARAGFDEAIIVIGAGHEKIAGGEPAVGDSARYVINKNYERGQTSSIKCGLESLPNNIGGFMIFPVDMPLVTIDECKKMRGTFQAREDMIVVPSFNKKRGHPVIFDIAYKKEFLALGDDEPAHGVIRAHEEKIVYVDTDNSWVLFDIDTDEDYEKAVKELANRNL